MPPNQKQPSSQIPKWDIAALIDLEYLSEEVETGDGNDLKQRDRAFFLSVRDGRKFSHEALASRPIILREWVTHRRQSPEFSEPGPGETTAELLAAVKFWGFLGCVLVGALFAWGALNISGKQVNVILFWCLTVGLPFVMTLLGFYFLLGDRFPQLPGPPGFRTWVGNSIVRAGSQTTTLFHRKASQAQARRMGRLSGEIKRRMHGRGEVLTIAFGSLVHLLGLGLTVGIFVSILVFRSISYQDYGWQTHSGWLTDTKVHSLVQVVATPWSWFAGNGSGYPTATQILETRIFHNDANTREYPAASVTWSSFLLWSSFFYGLLPRLALWVLGRVHLRRAFACEDFLKFDALWRRLTIPNVRVEHPGEDVSQPPTSLTVPQDASKILQGPELLLIPEELNAMKISERARIPLRSHDLEFSNVVQLPLLPSARHTLVDSLSTPPAIPPARILILQESFMPPNQSFERFIKELRRTFGDHLPIHLVLLHDPEAAQAAQHLDAWSSRLDPLGDPLLSFVTIRLEQEIPASST